MKRDDKLVSVRWNVLLSFIPLIEIWARYRIEKFWLALGLYYGLMFLVIFLFTGFHVLKQER